MEYIYLDNAATTPLDPQVFEIMRPYFTQSFFNSSSPYAPAERNKKVLQGARVTVAGVLGARPAEIIFTSGGSESDNLALKGVLEVQKQNGKNHLITSPVEHHAVLHPARYLEEHGYEVTFLPVAPDGSVSPQAVQDALRPNTGLISLILANNEVGTLNPIAEISRIARAAGVPLHTDAVQAAGNLSLKVDELGVDLLSLSAHKFYGPKGVGALYVRRGTPFEPQIHGGSQERDRRAGTENLPGIVGMATALQLADAHLAVTVPQQTQLRDRLIAGVLEKLPNAQLTGALPPNRLPNHASFCFAGINGETILLELEERGILCSSGSACAAGSSEPSHVLTAMGYPPELAYTAVRFTLGRTTTADDIDKVVAALTQVIHKLM